MASAELRQLSWTELARYFVFRILLWLTRSSRASRFAGVHRLRDTDAFKYGALPSTPEFLEEWPYEWKMLEARKLDDRVTIFCTSAEGQILAVNFIRGRAKIACVSLFLRTLRASYARTKECDVDLTADDTFAVDGLKIECVVPMRRWRISFNGLLENQATQKEEHVRFVFTANYTNNLADLGSFHSERLLALQLCKSPYVEFWHSISAPCSINLKLKEIDRLVQTCSFVGKVRTRENSIDAENHEEDVYSFGQKIRSHEKDSSPVESRGILMAYTRNGISLYLEEVGVTDFIRCLTTGVVHYPSFEHCRIDRARFPALERLNIGDNLEVQTVGYPLLRMEIEEVLLCRDATYQQNDKFRLREVRFLKIKLDDREGHAVVIGGMGPHVSPNVPKVPKHLLQTFASDFRPNVVSFEDDFCADGSLTGGKASSLAALTTLSISDELDGLIKVPRGVAITTAAYGEFSAQPGVASAIEKLLAVLRGRSDNERVELVCEKTVAVIGRQPLPESIRDDLKRNLRERFGEAMNDTKFAIRSSACGEDSEEMSAAGQMETILGVKGLPNIFEAVARCWASQFSFVAVRYKRRYGQAINCPMAVCVQEMVASDVSGVMFTVDPVTANPNYITITANYGLGESVVSATADPDTFVLEKRYPNAGRLVSSTIGSKTLRTVMLDEGGTRDITGLRNEDSCLDKNQLNQLARAALAVEKYYASQRDTEWAFAGEQLFLLQARPITAAHVLDAEFETYHGGDEGLVSEYDCFTKANVGEVFGGSTTPLTLDTTFRSFMTRFKEALMKAQGLEEWEAIFSREQFFFRQNSQTFFGTLTVTVDFARDDVVSKGLSVAMSGRVVDDEIMLIGAENKKRYSKIIIRPSLLKLIYDMWFADKVLDDAERFVRETEYTLDDCRTSREMFIRITSLPLWQQIAFDAHAKQIFYGTINNVFVLSLLSRADGGFTTRVYSDFAKMVASCNNVESADVPRSLQALSHQAFEDYGLKLKDFAPEDALEVLRTDSTRTAVLFREFLKDHGHRCLDEFDLISRPWSMDPIPVVKTIQALIGRTRPVEKSDVSVEQLLETMHIKLNYPRRQLLKFLIRRLAERMVQDGTLPDPDLLFFLVPSEILQLLDTRAPKIIVRAALRQRNRDRASKDIYPELSAGLPFKPINARLAPPQTKGSRRMEGTPVSQGTAVATARVVMSLDDAHQIEKGDILITYATDIGWSPYFPLLSGIVTELGGLISHGAVVAREYGLPCVVAAHGATQLFRSGEKILLDGTKGFLQTIE